MNDKIEIKMRNILIEQVSLQELILKIEETIKKYVPKEENPKRKDEVELLTRQETADLLKVSLVTLYQWNKKKILSPCRIGNRIYYRKEDLLIVIARPQSPKKI